MAALVLVIGVLYPGLAVADRPAQPERGPEAGRPAVAGLDTLLRAEASGNFALRNSSFTPGNDERRILFRIRPFVTVTPSDPVSARVEGQWYGYRDDADASVVSVYQAYLEGGQRGAKGVAVKVGRQEAVYGSGFLLGADAFYDGLTFDAVKVSLKRSGRASLDLFGGRYVTANSGGIEGTLYGIYGSCSPGDALAIDLYGIRDTGGSGATHVGGAHEVTYSLGTRFNGRIGRHVSFELEPVYQAGRKNRDGASHDAIRAYGGHADIVLEKPIGGAPVKVFVAYAYGSGDGDPGRGAFTEFHNPDNDTPLVGDTNVIGDLGGLTVGNAAASGLQVLTAGFSIEVTKALDISVSGHRFRANRVPDGFDREIGVETNLVLAWKARENISVLLSENRFFTGGFFRDAAGSGRDINYLYAQLQAAF